jgi:hypothetical protein
LSCVRTCAIIAEERPRITLTSSFTKLFQSLGLSSRCVSTTFGCRANIAVCLQGASDPDPTPVYVDQRALRNDRVTIVEKGSPHSICLLESGKVIYLFYFKICQKFLLCYMNMKIVTTRCESSHS